MQQHLERGEVWPSVDVKMRRLAPPRAIAQHVIGHGSDLGTFLIHNHELQPGHRKRAFEKAQSRILAGFEPRHLGLVDTQHVREIALTEIGETSRSTHIRRDVECLKFGVIGCRECAHDATIA